MKVCPFCAHGNREGVLFCEECGQVLFGGDLTATRKLARSTVQLEGKNTWGTARFSQHAVIMLQVRDNPNMVEIKPGTETTVGRYDPSSSVRPTIDMSTYGGYENGVSRMHAIIRRGEDTLTLIDLGSANGTHLNGQRLVPNQPRVLRDGDEVRFGKLVCRVFFRMMENNT